MRIDNISLKSTLLITGAVCLLVIFIPLLTSDWDPNSIIRVGTRYSSGDINGSEGYDGQFNLFIALDPRPEKLTAKLDVPAYRYQRIILPLLARFLSFANPSMIPWILIFLPLFGQLMGTYFVYRILELSHVPQIYTLVYGLGAGFLLSIRLALSEPIAFGLVAGAIYYFLLKKYPISYLFISCAFFSKEVTILFGVALLCHLIVNKQYRQSLFLLLIGFFPYIVFQFWLLREFGNFGIGSGGAMATPFEVIPFMGLIRIAKYHLLYFLAMVITFFPLVIFPSIWGVWVSIKTLIHRDFSFLTYALLVNSLIMFFLPFSTYCETGGILRFSCGLILSVLLFSAQYHKDKILKYSPFWIVYNVFLLKG